MHGLQEACSLRPAEIFDQYITSCASPHSSVRVLCTKNIQKMMRRKLSFTLPITGLYILQWIMPMTLFPSYLNLEQHLACNFERYNLLAPPILCKASSENNRQARVWANLWYVLPIIFSNICFKILYSFRLQTHHFKYLPEVITRISQRHTYWICIHFKSHKNPWVEFSSST